MTTTPDTLSAKWSKNIIIADAEFIDKVAFDLIVNFERMIGRRIPPADMARWIECVALDGGLRPGSTSAADPQAATSLSATVSSPQAESTTHAVLVHQKEHQRLNNFMPCYYDELNGKAFASQLGECSMQTIAVENHLVGKEALLLDIVATAATQPEVERIMVVVQEELLQKVPTAVAKTSNEKRITLFAMQPIASGGCRSEILGYSLMAALGIKSSEIKAS